jgi:hypothetical protein
MYHLGVAAVLAVGGRYAVSGQAEVGTVVAFLSGLAKVNESWGDIVNWFSERTVVGVKYRLVAEAAEWLSCKQRDSKQAPAPLPSET